MASRGRGRGKIISRDTSQLCARNTSSSSNDSTDSEIINDYTVYDDIEIAGSVVHSPVISSASRLVLPVLSQENAIIASQGVLGGVGQVDAVANTVIVSSMQGVRGHVGMATGSSPGGHRSPIEDVRRGESAGRDRPSPKDNSQAVGSQGDQRQRSAEKTIDGQRTGLQGLRASFNRVDDDERFDLTQADRYLTSSDDVVVMDSQRLTSSPDIVYGSQPDRGRQELHMLEDGRRLVRSPQVQGTTASGLVSVRSTGDSFGTGPRNVSPKNTVVPGPVDVVSPMTGLVGQVARSSMADKSKVARRLPVPDVSDRGQVLRQDQVFKEEYLVPPSQSVPVFSTAGVGRGSRTEVNRPRSADRVVRSVPVSGSQVGQTDVVATVEHQLVMYASSADV